MANSQRLLQLSSQCLYTLLVSKKFGFGIIRGLSETIWTLYVLYLVLHYLSSLCCLHYLGFLATPLKLKMLFTTHTTPTCMHVRHNKYRECNSMCGIDNILTLKGIDTQ